MLSISFGFRLRISETLLAATPSMIISGSVVFIEEAPRRFIDHDSSPGALEPRVMITPAT